MNKTPNAAVTERKIRPQRLADYGLGACFAVSILVALYYSWNWGMGKDSWLIHYVIFLMAHGFAPYRDIVEMNMPGSYMVEWAGMKVFGPGPAAWRCYDIFLMAVSAAAGWVIVRPRGRTAGLTGAALMFLYHLSRGQFELGQRDYEMAVLLLVGVASLLVSLRTSLPPMMAVFAACCGFAAGIKPVVVPLPFLLLAAAWLELRRTGRRRIAPWLGWSMVGAAAPTLAIAAFLQYNHAWAAFYETLMRLDRYHRAHGNMSIADMARIFRQWEFYPLWAVGIYGSARLWPTWDWEEKLLLGTAGFGLAAYFYQGKGWSYQAAFFELFFILWIARMGAGWIRRGAPRGRLSSAWVAAAVSIALLLPALYIPVAVCRHQPRPDALAASLTRDLNALGGSALSGRVQCLDWTDGCIGVLYTQRLLPATGDIYDFYLFPADPAPITELEQQRFLQKVQARPPRVIVLTDYDWISFQGFGKLDRWPAFRDWLEKNYTIASERHPDDRAYRLYVLR